MAFGKTAGCVILLGAAVVSAAQFPVRHEHWQDHCNGVLTVDESGVSFAGEKKHRWNWRYEDIQELRLAPDEIYVLTYRDNKLLLGSDRSYRFTGKVPAGELTALLQDQLSQRFVEAMGQAADAPLWSVPVKHLGAISGNEGTLTFGQDRIVYSTAAKRDSRTWRYADIDNISTSGPYQLTITTFERDKYNYGDRKGFNFQLKAPLAAAKYDELWMLLEEKNGKIQ